MEPQFPPSASQPLRRSCPSRHDMMNQASLRHILQQPASPSQARAMPLDPDVQVLLGIESWPSTRTWTPASEVPDFLDEDTQDETLAVFAEEYRRVAAENGLQVPVAGDAAVTRLETPGPQQSGLLRRIFAGPSSLDAASRGLNRQCVSDLAYVRRYKPDVYTPVSLADLERLTGKSLLRLPPDFAPFPLVIPTCLRACVQKLVENANTRGIFRVSGSERVVELLSRYYDCASAHEAVVSGTVLQDTLPVHIAHTIHDVAATFKRFLSRLTGGVLASPTLFNALVAIHERVDGHAHLRARLIALAINSIKSKRIRHVIYALFGLLNMIGRITELSPSELVDGRPLHPDHQFLDYKGLGVCIGPLLTNDPPLKSAQPTSGLLPVSWSSKLLRRSTQNVTDDAKAREAKVREAMVDRARVAAGVAGMLITYWRDVVQELKDLNNRARNGVATLHLEYSEMPPLSSDPDIGNLLVDSDVPFGKNSVDSQETLFPTTPAAANGQRAASGGQKPAATCRRLSRSGAIRRPTVGTSRTSSRSFTEANLSDYLAQSMSMDAIPRRASSRYTVHFGVSEMAPTDEKDSTNVANNQTPIAEKSFIVRERPVEEPDQEMIRPPLPARLREKGKAIKDSLLTHASEMLGCDNQPTRSSLDDLDSFDHLNLLPLERYATIRRPDRHLPPSLPNGAADGSDDMTIIDVQPRYLIDFARNRDPIVFEQGNNEARPSKSASRGISRK